MYVCGVQVFSATLRRWIDFEPSLREIYRGIYSLDTFANKEKTVKNLDFNRKNLFIVNTDSDGSGPKIGHFLALLVYPPFSYGIWFDSFALKPQFYDPDIPYKIAQLTTGTREAAIKRNRKTGDIPDLSIGIAPFQLQSKSSSLCGPWTIWAALQFVKSNGKTNIVDQEHLQRFGFVENQEELNDRRLIDYFKNRYQGQGILNEETSDICLPIFDSKASDCFSLENLLSKPLDVE
jgi:hypothetical protein